MDKNDLHDELDAFVLGDVELEVDEPIEAPRDADRANVLLRVFRGVEREARQIDMLATQEMTRIESWRADRLAGLDRRRAALVAALEQWMRAVNRVSPARKTENLPNGTLKLRAPRGRVEIDDDAAFVEWWKSDAVMTVAKRLRDFGVIDVDVETFAPEIVELVLSRSPLVRVKIEPNKTGIAEVCVTGPRDVVDGVERATLVLDGEPVPHVTLTKYADDTFSIS